MLIAWFETWLMILWFFMNFQFVDTGMSLSTSEVAYCIVLYCLGVNMFEAYRQKCSAEDLSRLKTALCSGEIIIIIIIMRKHCLSVYWMIFRFLNSYWPSCQYKKYKWLSYGRETAIGLLCFRLTSSFIWKITKLHFWATLRGHPRQYKRFIWKF